MLHASLAILALPLLAAAKKPNLVMMVLDDVGWADVGYHGSNFSTPNIDRLAAEGVQLERYYVQPVCSPTRSAFMTARYPFRTGMQHCTTLMPTSTAALPMDKPTVAEALRGAGYSTAAIGKWHLGYASWDNTPVGRGFDSYVGYLQGQSDYYGRNLASPIANGLDVWRNRTCAWEMVGEFSMDSYQKEAQRLLDERDPSKPFFLYYAHQEIHIPLQNPPGSECADACKNVALSLPNGENRNTLCQMTSRLDKAVGEFVEMLKSRALWDDTLIWVTTDNGGMTQFVANFPASASSNFPLRGGKVTLFEGGVRGVSFLTGGFLPAKAAGTKYSGLLQHVDVPATMLGLAGATSPDIDGFDVWEAVTSGAASPRTEAPLNVDVGAVITCLGAPGAKEDGMLSAIIQGDWKLINGHRGLYDGYWSNDPYVHTPAPQDAARIGDEDVWLFNVAEDPEERCNVAADNVPRVLQLQARLKELSDPAKGYRPAQDNKFHVAGLPRFHNGTWSPWLGRKDDSEEIVV